MAATKENWADKIKFSDFQTHRDISAKEAKKVKDIITWFIYRSPYRLTASRLMKLFYMSEIRAIEKLGRRLSTVDFVNWKYGPWSQAVAMVADSVHSDIEMSKGTSCNKKFKVYKAKKPETEVDIEKEDLDVLAEVLDEWKNKETGALVQASKKTEPFEESNYGEVIDFNSYIECLAELKSKHAQEEMNKNFADATAGKGIAIKNKTELEKYRAAS